MEEKEKTTESKNEAEIAGKRRMGSGTKTKAFSAFLTLSLIISAVAIVFLSSFIFPPLVNHQEPDEFISFPERPMGPPLEVTNAYFIRFALTLLNILILIYLIYIYVQDYLLLKSNFTLGLVAFLFSFLLYALSSLPLVHSLFRGFGVSGMFSFVPLLFSGIGLLIFAKLSNE